MENNNEQEERYILKGGVEFNDIREENDDSYEYEEKYSGRYQNIGLTSILNELKKIPSLNIDNELLTPIKQEYAIQEYKIANNDNEIKKLQTENEILKKQQNENRKLINSIKKKESNITKINVPGNTKYISFQTVQDEEPIIQKQRILADKEYENALKMKEIADSLYGSDEEYFKKFYDNNKKPVWHIPEKTITKRKVNAISDSEKMFFPQGTLADMPPAKLPDINKQKDYNEIAEMFYPDMEVKKEINELSKPDNKLFIMPVEGGYISSGYGRRKSPGPGASTFHSGIDIAIPVGTPVKAIGDGKVRIATGGIKGYGNAVYINHGEINGKIVESEYGHLSTFYVTVGEKVKKGQVIALSGGKKGAPGSGVSQGPQLHLTIREYDKDSKKRESVEPYKYIMK